MAETRRMKILKKSNKLDDILYDIRGRALERARLLEEEGYRILRLNIGNPAPFGFAAPDEIIHDVILNINEAHGYSDSKGLFTARKAVMQECQRRGIEGVEIEDIYTGNGVSELIVMAMQALCNTGDEILIPMPDYPLWTAAVRLSGGKPVHYLCDESSDWNPDLRDLKRKIGPRTKGIVVINPNNPTGANYSPEILQRIVSIAAERGLILFSDEIYEKILYDDEVVTPLATLGGDVPVVTFNGLSKAYRIAGFRSGWMIVSGYRGAVRDYIAGLDMLAAMRLCSNVPAQLAIQTSLGGRQSIRDLVLPGGRLREQRDAAWSALTAIPGVSCVKPRGAFYLFPRLDTARFHITDDRQFILDLLVAEKVLLVQGTGFNWPRPDHFRIVFLPVMEELKEAMARLSRFLDHYRQ